MPSRITFIHWRKNTILWDFVVLMKIRWSWHNTRSSTCASAVAVMELQFRKAKKNVDTSLITVFKPLFILLNVFTADVSCSVVVRFSPFCTPWEVKEDRFWSGRDFSHLKWCVAEWSTVPNRHGISCFQSESINLCTQVIWN